MIKGAKTFFVLTFAVIFLKLIRCFANKTMHLIQYNTNPTSHTPLRWKVNWHGAGTWETRRGECHEVTSRRFWIVFVTSLLLNCFCRRRTAHFVFYLVCGKTVFYELVTNNYWSGNISKTESTCSNGFLVLVPHLGDYENDTYNQVMRFLLQMSHH